MTNKKKKILEEALKMHEAAGGTYSSPEAVAKQRYANARHEIAKDYYNQYFGAKQSESLAKSGEKERNQAADKPKETRDTQPLRTSGAEQIALAESRAAKAKKDLEDYMGSDERKQKEEAHKKQELSRFTQQLLGGNADIMQPQMLRDEKEAQLRKEADKAGKTQAVLDSAQASQERARETTSTEEADLAEIQAMTPEERRQLDEYIFNREQKFYSGFDPTKSDLMTPQMPVVSPLEQKYGKKRLDELAESQSRKNQRDISEKALQDAAASAGGSVADAVGHSALAVLAGASSGVGKGLDYLKDKALGTERYDGMDPNGAGSFLGNYAGTVQGTVADKIEGDTYDEEGNLVEDGGWLRKGLSMGYQGLMSAAESSVRALLFGGAAGGAAVAAADTFVDGVNEAMASGATQGQATSIGMAKAMVEFITEKIPMDRLTDLIKGGGKSLLRNMAAQAGEEATTEVASYAASILAEWGILREKSGYQQKIAKYILEGVSPEEAKKLVDREVLNEATETAIVSGFAGALGGISGTYIGNKVEENAQGDLEQVIQQEESQPGDQQGGSPLSVQQDPVGQSTESAPVMPEEAASAPEARELDVVTQAVQQAQQNREAAQNAQQEPTLAQLLTPEQRVQEAVKGVRKKEADAVQQEADAQAAAWRGELVPETAEAEQLAVDRADSLAKEEAPPKPEPRMVVSDNYAPPDPMEQRSWADVGSKKVKAFMHENPEVKDLFRMEAQNLLMELDDYQPGQRFYDDQAYYESGGESGWYGQKRFASKHIEELLDNGVRAEDIRKGLEAIIHDQGAENNAASKRIEFILSDRLRNGYKSWYTGEYVPPSPEYIGVLEKRQQDREWAQYTEAFERDMDSMVPPKQEPNTPPPDLYEQKPAMGAADQNFTGKAAYADLLQKGNVQRDRPGDVRPVEVPKKDGAGRRVTEFAGNAYGAKATPDYMANEIESLIQDGKLGFDTRSNQESLRRAAAALEGNIEGVKAQITENLANDKVQDGDIEKAMLLYVKNANSKDKADQEAAAQILVQLGKMANITGRNLQLFRMLRRMTPEGQLLYIEKSARSMVDSLNQKRGAGKKAVPRRKEQAEHAVEAVKQARRQAENAVKEAGSRVRYKDGAFKVDGAPAMSKYVQKVGEALAKYAKEESGDKKPVQAAVRSALKDIGETLSSVARSSGQKKDAVEARIVEVLVNKYNFSEPDASKVADVVKEQYRDMVKEKSKSILEKKFQQRKPAKRKTSDQIFDELANLGAFDADSEFNQAAAEKWLKTKDTYIEPELAKAYLDAKTDDEKEAALNNIYKDVASRIPATLGEKWDAWRNMAMLLNPKTHIRNMGATGSFLPFVDVKRVIGAALEKVLLDEEQRTKAVLGSDKRSKALLKWAKEDAKKPKVIERLGQSGTTGDNARSKIQEYRQILPGILDKVRKGNMAAMEAEDRLFKRITYARSLASFLKARGYSETDIQGGLVPAGVLEEGRTLAIQEAQKATFNDRNKFSDSLAKLANTVDDLHPVMAFMRKGLLPFVRTPANVVKRLTEYNPLTPVTLLLTAKKDLDSGKKTAADIIDEVSSGLTGAAAIALGAALASGFVPDVELVGEATEEEKEQGAIDYSIRIGDNYYGVGWLSPTMIPLFIGATLTNAYVSAHSNEEAGVDGWDFADGLVSIGADILNPMMELSMLSSLHELGERLKNEEDPGDMAIAGFMHTVTSYFTQGLPTIFGQAEQAAETEKSSTYVNTDNPTEKAIKKTLGDATRRIPGLDLYQTPRRDEWGMAIENEGSPLERVANAFFNPFTVSKRKNDPLTKEIARLNEATGEDLTPPMPTRVINYTDADGNQHKNVRLTQEQYDKLAQTQGETAKELVTALTESDDYKAMDDEQKAASLKLAYEYAKETAEIAAMDDHLGYSETWKEELNEAKKPADFILRRVSGSELNKAMSAMDTAWDHNWATDVKSKALETAYENYKAMSPAARREVEAFATGTTAKYLEARRNGISHKDFLAAAKNVETVKGTGKYNSETKKNTVKDIDKREAIAKTTGLTEHQVDIIMKAYMPDYDPDAEKKEKTELKYDYIRQELGMTPVEYADTYRAYLENAKKYEKIAAIQDLGYDYTTASKLYRLYQGKIDVVAWAGK